MTSTAKKILLIDDSVSDIFLVQRILRDYPPLSSHSAIVFDNISDAKEYLGMHGENITLVLLDLGLPDTVDGRDSYAQIRTVNENIPVIALTSIENRELAVDLMAMGLEDFVCKSDILYAPQMLAKAIDFALSRNVQKEHSVRSLMQTLENQDSLLASLGFQ